MFCCVQGAFAATYILYDGLRYEIKDNATLEIAGLAPDNNSTDIVVPQTVYGASVTGVAQNAFLNNTSLHTIQLPESITQIGMNAFYGCSSLSEITIPKNAATIGSNAFYGCSSLASVNIEAEIEQIPPYCFNRCEALEEITIPKSVRKIGDYAFYRCIKLKRAVIKSQEITIGTDVFEEFFGLTLVGFEGTDVQRYAEEYSIDFEALTEEPEPSEPDPSEPDVFEMGDVNKDGSVNGEDTTLVLKFVVKKIDESGLFTELADLNGDGTVNVKDATCIQRKILN